MGVAAGVAILLVAIVSSVVALVIGILVRRKSSKIREKEDEPLELSNPNYIYDSEYNRRKLNMEDCNCSFIVGNTLAMFLENGCCYS